MVNRFISFSFADEILASYLSKSIVVTSGVAEVCVLLHGRAGESNDLSLRGPPDIFYINFDLHAKIE